MQQKEETQIKLVIIEENAEIRTPIVDKDNSQKEVRHNPFGNLTPKELEVVEALADGLSYKLVANRLNISANTLPGYIKTIYRKLQVNSKSEVLLLYTKNKF